MAEPAVLALVTAAFVVEGALGFGASVVVATLGALLFDPARVMPAFVTANLALSLWVAASAWRCVDARLLVGGILPPVALGLGLGLALPAGANHPAARVAFGLLVAALAARELHRALRSVDGGRPLPAGLGFGLLALGGVVHGVFAAGGPLVVLVVSRRATDPRVFRATLSTLWLVLNTALVLGWAARDVWTTRTLRDAVLLTPAVLLGGALGSALHRALPARGFRLAAAAVLGLSGLSLAARTLADV